MSMQSATSAMRNPASTTCAMIFSFFAVQIGHTIVPAQFKEQGLLLVLATFGVVNLAALVRELRRREPAP